MKRAGAPRETGGRARLRLGQPAVRPSGRSRGRGRRHGHLRCRQPAPPTASWCPASARTRPAWTASTTVAGPVICATGCDSRAPGTGHLRRHAGPVRRRRRAGRCRSGLGAIGRATCSSWMPPCCRTWAGTPSIAAADPRCSLGLTRDERFYFVHSYAARRRPGPGQPPREHGERFVAAVEDGPCAATQFHPEKSGDAGARSRNWLEAACMTLDAAARRRRRRRPGRAAGRRATPAARPYGDPLEAALPGRRRVPSGSTWSTSTPRSVGATNARCWPTSSAGWT